MMIFSKKSFISLLALITLSLLLIIGSYFSIAVLNEMKISESYIKSSQAYYLAEAGIYEAIWKLRNDTTTTDGDDAWRNDFITPGICETFSDSFVRQNHLYPNSSYTVTIKNSDCGRGEIVATAKIITANNREVQRVVKTKVFKPQNPSPIEDIAVLTSGPAQNIIFSAGLMNIYDGNLFVNNNLILQLVSTLNIYDNPSTPQQEGQALVVRNINKHIFSTINATRQCSGGGHCDDGCERCPPESVSMVMVDFDSASPASYKSRATALGTVYTASQFEEMLWANPNLTLNNEVTYVTGQVELKGNRHLTINGILVADGNIKVGENLCWIRGFPWPCGNSKLTINNTPGKPSGILTKGGFSFGAFANQVNVEGLLYASNKFDITSMPQSFNVRGGIVARQMHFISIWQALNITMDNDIVSDAIGNPAYSPVIQIDHWEETY